MSSTSSSFNHRPGDLPEGMAADEANDVDALEHEAATWAVRCNAGLDAQGQAALQAWLAADPRHGPALDAMRASIAGVQSLPAHDLARLRAGLPQRDAQASTPRPRFWQAWLRPLVPYAATALVAAAVVGAGWFGWWVQPSFQQSYASQRGQQLMVTLPDDAASGSTVQLDTDTHLSARLYRNRREVALADGQAMFSVHSDPGRPFQVLAGDLRITVVGTRFSVRHTAQGVGAGHTQVAVEEGRVKVERLQRDADQTDKAPAMVLLTAGQMLEGGNAQDAGLGTVTEVAPAAVAQWRSGRLSFNRTPLAQALAEFERYGPTGLVVRDPAVAALPVGGSYGLNQHQRFAEFLPHLLPVRLVKRDGVTEIVAR